MKLPQSGRRASSLALLLCLGLSGGLGLSGCDDTTGFVASSPPSPRLASAPTALGLHVGDKIKVVVIGDDKISGEYEIDQAGDISIPAAGALHAAGRTKTELETAIARRLVDRQFLRSPMVTVSVSAFRPFYVLGEVERPGEYPYHTGLNILSAIAVAGGNTYRANQSHALVQHAGETSFHLYPLSPDVPINPGDLIKLPERYF